MFLIAMFDNNVDNSDNLLSLQKVLLEIHHAIQLEAEINCTTEMVYVSKRLHVTAALDRRKRQLPKGKRCSVAFFKWVTETVQTKDFFILLLFYINFVR